MKKHKILIIFVLCVIGGLTEGILIYEYLPIAIALIVLLPGLVVFFGETINNIGKEK